MTESVSWGTQGHEIAHAAEEVEFCPPQGGGWGLVCIGHEELTTVRLHDGTVVGAEPNGCGTVCLPGLAVADKHARFEVRPDGVYIEDLNTASGTRVDGVPAGTLALAHGCVVRMGEQVCVFVERDLDSYAGPIERFGDELVLGQRQWSWARAALQYAQARQSFMIEGEAGTGKAALARACVAKVFGGEPVRVIDARDKGELTVLHEVGIQLTRCWLVLHAERLPRSTQVCISRLVRRVPGSILIATSDPSCDRSAHQGVLVPPMLSLIAGRRVRVPRLEHRREDLAAIAVALAERRGAALSCTNADVIELITRGGWPTGVGGLSEALEDVLQPGTSAGEALECLRSRIARAEHSAPLPLSAADPDLARARLTHALIQTAGMVTSAARQLSISRQTLYRQSRRLGVPVSRRPPRTGDDQSDVPEAPCTCSQEPDTRD